MREGVHRACAARTGWNFVEAAKVLDIQRTYLHQKVTALGIVRQS